MTKEEIFDDITKHVSQLKERSEALISSKEEQEEFVKQSNEITQHIESLSNEDQVWLNQAYLKWIEDNFD